MRLRGTVFSKTLEMDTGITIITPNVIKPGQYRVAYLLHGLFGNNESWADYTMLPHFANDYDIIFVMPEVGRSFYTDMTHGLKYFSYITEELPLICKSVFNISTRREDTAVIGGSMGGYGALKCALTKPEQYGICCAFASACLFMKEHFDLQIHEGETPEFKAAYGEQLYNDFHSIFGKDMEWKPEYEILSLASRINSQTKPKIYCACGTQDYLHELNVRFSGEMKRLDFDFTYDEWPGRHDWLFFNEALKRALDACFKLRKI